MTAAILDTLFIKQKAKGFLGRQHEFGPDTRFAEFDDMIIRYQRTGNGAHTIVLVPDPPNTIEHLQHLTTLLAKHYSVLAFEFPGFGFSVPKTTNYQFSLSDGIQTTLKILSYLRINSCTLAFPCVAGYIAFLLAGQRPDIIKHVIAIQVPDWEEELNWSVRVDLYGLIRTPIVGQLLLSSFKRRIAKQWYDAALPKGNRDPTFYNVCKSGLDKGSCFCLSSAFQALFNSPRPNFEKIKQKGIIVWGKKDRTHRKTNRQTTLSFFENADVFEFDEAGHFPELENPERFAEIVRSTLGEKQI